MGVAGHAARVVLFHQRALAGRDFISDGTLRRTVGRACTSARLHTVRSVSRERERATTDKVDRSQTKARQKRNGHIERGCARRTFDWHTAQHSPGSVFLDYKVQCRTSGVHPRPMFAHIGASAMSHVDVRVSATGLSVTTESRRGVSSHLRSVSGFSLDLDPQASRQSNGQRVGLRYCMRRHLGRRSSGQCFSWPMRTGSSIHLVTRKPRG